MLPTFNMLKEVIYECMHTCRIHSREAKGIFIKKEASSNKNDSKRCVIYIVVHMVEFYTGKVGIPTTSI